MRDDGMTVEFVLMCVTVCTAAVIFARSV